jgi:hypothetical protein
MFITDRVSFDNSCEGLSSALTRIAECRGIPKADAASQVEKQKRKILRALTQKASEKLRNYRYHATTISPWEKKEKLRKPSIALATLQVRLKQNKQNLRGAKLKGETAIDEALSATFNDLNPVEKRAVYLLRGAKRKSKKNPIEQKAIKIVDAIIDDWSPAVKRGRPKGARSQRIRLCENRGWRVRLSVDEIIDVVTPLIEEFSKTNVRVSISKTPSPEFAAVIAAVRIGQPECGDESVARIMARRRKKIRSAKAPAK